jgi:hypothetical protein
MQLFRNFLAEYPADVPPLGKIRILPVQLYREREVGGTLSICPSELYLDLEHYTGGLPWLRGELLAAAPQTYLLITRIHNRAGIPMIAGQVPIRRGERTFIVRDQQPIGIEAYRHYSEAQRLLIAQRVWPRGVFASLELCEIPSQT